MSIVTHTSQTELGPISNVKDLLDLFLIRKQEPENEWIYRGQSDARWWPIPKVDRPPYVNYRKSRGWSRKKHEERLLIDFKKWARPHLHMTPDSDWEWLAIAQHHGLATRLLDWTVNPLAALFFAVEDGDSEEDSALWAYHHGGGSWLYPKNEGPFETDEMRSFWPPHIAPRISAQQACFTSHPEPFEYSLYHWQGDRIRIGIEGSAHARILQDLMKLGITRASLFPDLDGVTRNLNWKLSEVDVGE